MAPTPPSGTAAAASRPRVGRGLRGSTAGPPPPTHAPAPRPRRRESHRHPARVALDCPSQLDVPSSHRSRAPSSTDSTDSTDITCSWLYEVPPRGDRWVTLGLPRATSQSVSQSATLGSLYNTVQGGESKLGSLSTIPHLERTRNLRSDPCDDGGVVCLLAGRWAYT